MYVLPLTKLFPCFLQDINKQPFFNEVKFITELGKLYAWKLEYVIININMFYH